MAFITDVACLVDGDDFGMDEGSVVEDLAATENFFDAGSRVSFGRNELSSSDKSPDKSISSSTANNQLLIF